MEMSTKRKITSTISLAGFQNPLSSKTQSTTSTVALSFEYDEFVHSSHTNIPFKPAFALRKDFNVRKFVANLVIAGRDNSLFFVLPHKVEDPSVIIYELANIPYLLYTFFYPRNFT